MKFNPMNFISKLFDNKKFLMAFSLVCAVIFWLVIDITANPTREVTVADITVSVADQTDDNGQELLVVGENKTEVSVTVSGPGYIVSNVSKEDIVVSVVSYADVNKPGTYVLNLTAKVELSGCTVTKISPSYLRVDYDYDTSADIPVETDVSEFLKLLPQDREIFKSSLKSNADGADIPLLNVTGPSEIIGSISKVVVTPVLPNDVQPDSQNLPATLVFYDATGKAVDSSKLVYNTDTYVRVVVYKVADVSLTPTFVNLPKCYGQNPPYKLYSYSETARAKAELTKVKVKGPVEAIDKLISTGLNLSQIDFMNVNSQNKSFNVSFVLPEGVEVVDGTEEITVSLELGSLKTAEITIDPGKIEFIGLPDGLKGSSAITGKTIKVKICYDRNKTTLTEAKNGIRLQIDCSGITTPSSITKVIVATTNSDKVFAWANSIDPQETIVEIK